MKKAEESGSLFGIIDSRMGAYPSECVERFIGLALRCCEDKPERRPCILDVVRELENLVLLLPESMNLSDTSSFQSRTTCTTATTTTTASTTTSFIVYARMPSDVSGSDLTTTVMPAVPPR